MIRGIHHVALATSDIDRLVKFYQEGFGFEVVANTGAEFEAFLRGEIARWKQVVQTANIQPN